MPWPDHEVRPSFLVLLLTAWAGDPRAVEAAKAKLAGPTPVPATVDWAAAEAVRVAIPDEKLRAAADEMRLPVLLPAEPMLAGTARWASGEGWYGVTMTDAEVSVYLHATTLWQRSPEALPARKGKGEAPVSMTDGIATLSFTRFGVAYFVDVECLADGCDAAARARVLVGELQFVGGRP